MRRTSTARSIARRTNDVQPTAILGAMSMIATLMMLWTSLVL